MKAERDMQGDQPFTPRRATRFRSALLAWYRGVRRDLPWRRSRDPYAIWVSETMLQQTQVATEIPYYLRFLERFPTVRALAAADIDDVLPLWSGLGYYRRARHLHAAARQICSEHGGKLPREAGQWLALPGVGRYTAGAVTSIAYGAREPILDGNVTRILCRLFAIDQEPNRGPVKERLWRLAGDLLPRTGSGDFNQALMELGATVCLPLRPACLLCPVRAFCSARRLGIQESLPTCGRPARTEKVTLVSALIERRGRLLLVQRRHATLMDGLWELPTVELSGEIASAPLVFLERYGLRLSDLRELGTATHAITYRRIRLYVCRARLRGGVGTVKSDTRWIQPQEISKYGVSSLSLKALRFFPATSR